MRNTETERAVRATEIKDEESCMKGKGREKEKGVKLG
jgi:hypothetical protein